MNTGGRERLYSFILYLNKGWTPSVGGKLRVYEDDGSHYDVAPTAGTLVGVDGEELLQKVDGEPLVELCEGVGQLGGLRLETAQAILESALGSEQVRRSGL